MIEYDKGDTALLQSESWKVWTKTLYSFEQIQRIKYLIAHHHTYNEIDGIDYQILVEADFIVSLFELNDKYKAIMVLKKISKLGRKKCFNVLMFFGKKVTIFKKKDKQTWEKIKDISKQEGFKGVRSSHYHYHADSLRT